MKQAVFLFLVLFLASCASVPSTDRSRAEADVREAVFRYQFAEWKRPDASAFYLDVSGQDSDPSDEFLQRFVGNHPIVKKISQGKVHHQGEGVTDVETGANGVIFRAGTVTWITDAEAMVSGGFYENGQSATGNTYTVRLQHGRWTVVKDRIEWITRADYLELGVQLCSI